MSNLEENLTPPLHEFLETLASLQMRTAESWQHLRYHLESEFDVSASRLLSITPNDGLEREETIDVLKSSMCKVKRWKSMGFYIVLHRFTTLEAPPLERNAARLANSSMKRRRRGRHLRWEKELREAKRCNGRIWYWTMDCYGLLWITTYRAFFILPSCRLE